MPANSPYSLLFEPVRIGPVTAPNRFYQVPHCNGMGHLRPNDCIAMREVKAEGGWGVVCTEECEIDPSSEFSPSVEARLWDERDARVLARMAAAVHAHGALAGIELAYNGPAVANRLSRMIPLAPSSMPVDPFDPVQARAMDKADIRAFRGWHRRAALLARDAGFDVIYVYAGHALALPMHFLSRRYNRRTDEYGGGLANRARLLRELIEDTRAAVGDRSAVAVRFSVDELLGPEGISADGEGREIVEMLAELPDLWDVNLSDWSNDSQTSRFAPEGYQREYIQFVKQVTSKPVVGVGRFTTPQAMLAQVRDGIVDFIGAARPSIADPFLPAKIQQGREDEIRECIGCNICVSGDFTQTPIRCTQNPTMGEEWRRGWHPERLPPCSNPRRVLVVGAGPAGLECALSLARRGVSVQLAEAGREPGGRSLRESRLPGLAAWARIHEHRLYMLSKQERVEIYPHSPLQFEDILGLEAEQVVLATGSHWRRDGLGRCNRGSLELSSDLPVLTPDDLMSGRRPPPGPVLIFDDDHFYMGGVLAELLRREGYPVGLVTPAAEVSCWTHNTLEQERIQRRLAGLGVVMRVQHNMIRGRAGQVELEDLVSGQHSTQEAGAVVLVTAREPQDELYGQLRQAPQQCAAAGIQRVLAVGDCVAPGTLAAAVYSGHQLAREIDREPGDALEMRREISVAVEAQDSGSQAAEHG